MQKNYQKITMKMIKENNPEIIKKLLSYFNKEKIKIKNLNDSLYKNQKFIKENLRTIKPEYRQGCINAIEINKIDIKANEHIIKTFNELIKDLEKQL